MPGLYDAYQLANSKSIPQYQGSTIPELTKVADTMEGRYDTGIQQADLLDQSIKTSMAHPVDQPLLNSLKDQYRDKLQGYAQKGNYEDMWRNVAIDARDFTNKVKPIAANQQAISSWNADMNKRVTEGKLSPNVAKARQLQMQDTYRGLKVDPETGQYTNPFVGTSSVPSIDIPEKVNKWLSESHAVERGWKAEKDENGWYVTNGTERKSLPWEKIKPVIDAGVNLDPEVGAYLQQEHELAPYYHGIPASKLTPEQREQIGGLQRTQAINSIYDYAHKGIVDVQKGEYAERMDPVTEELAKKKIKDPIMFSAPFSDVGPGQKIEGAKDFKGIQDNARKTTADAATQLNAITHAPDVVQQGNSFFRKEPTGELTNIDADVQRLQSQVDLSKSKEAELENVRKAAANAVNYHPEQASPALKKQAQEQADEYKKEAIKNLTINRDMKGNPLPGYKVPQQADIDQINKTAEDTRQEYVATNHPAYKDYEQELVKRMQPQGVGNNMFIFNDDQQKKALGDFATSAISKLGVDQGMVSLKITSGKNAGQDLSAGDYDDIQGKIVPVGITNDAKTGETKIVMRANQDIRGKKIKGENMLMSIKDVGGLDDYLKKSLKPEEYHQFTLDRALKSSLNNAAGQTSFPISDRNGQVIDHIRITRKQSGTQGPGAFEVRIPTPSGFKAISADSYDGVIDIINKLQANHQ